MAIGIGVSIAKTAVLARMSEVNSFYARVVAAGGIISDYSALRQAVLDYRSVQALNPSLYTFASGRKAGTLFSLIPTDGSGDLSVTRSGSTAMELNKDGFWQPVAANVPRFDYINNTPLINVEAQSTNLLTRPRSFAHSDWTKSGARIEGDPATAGSELVVNGGFDNTNNWGNSVAWSISGGTANVNGNGDLYQLNVYKNAGMLKITFDVSNFVSRSTFSLIDYNSIVLHTFTFNGNGSVVAYYYFTGISNKTFYFRAASCNFSIDNVSIKEVTGFACPFVDSAGVNTNEGYNLVATANNGYIRLATPLTITNAAPYTNSIWIKRISGTGDVYIIDTNTADRVKVITGEWVRYDYTATSSSTSGQIGVKLATAGDVVRICGSQPEAGAVASSFIYGAEGSTQTRPIDNVYDDTDRSNVKTLVINNDAYIVETALPNNGYYLPQQRIESLKMFTDTLTDEQITAAGWTKKTLAFSAYIDVAAGVSVAIEVNGNGVIEWGDGTSDSYSSQVTKTHVYAGGYKGLILFTGTLTRFNTASNAKWYFNINDLPANLTTLYIAGSNTITGDIASAPAGLIYLYIAGSNTITGNIANAPAGLIYLYITGSNTLSGNIADAPANLTSLVLTGSNPITGNIANAPANLTTLIITNSNTLTGDIANAPANLTTLIISGSNTLADYTAGRTWAANYNYLYIRQATGYGLSSSEVDNLLIDLAAATWGGGSRTLDIIGVNAARTSASDAAVATLLSQSVNVLTN